MFTEEDEYFDAEEMEEDDLDDNIQYESQIEDEDQETYFMGTQSQAQIDSSIIAQDQCSKIDPTSTGDNLPITHRIEIDRDQIKEFKIHLQEHK